MSGLQTHPLVNINDYYPPMMFRSLNFGVLVAALLATVGCSSDGTSTAEFACISELEDQGYSNVLATSSSADSDSRWTVYLTVSSMPAICNVSESNGKFNISVSLR